MIALFLLSCGGDEAGIDSCQDQEDNDGDDLADCDDPDCADLCTVRPPDAVLVEPATPYDTDPLSCVWTGSREDALGHLAPLSFSWTEDGVTLAGETDGALLAEVTEVGSLYACTAEATGRVNKAEGTSAPVEIVNRPPPAPVLQVVPVDPTADQQLSCSVVDPSDDPDGHPVALTFSWWRYEGVDVVQMGEGSIYGPDLNLAGVLVSCQAVPFDGYDEGELGESPFVSVNPPP